MEFDKNTTAFLVMDYQNELVHENGKAAGMTYAHVKQQNAIEHTKKALEKARNKGLKVIFVKVDYGKGYAKLKSATSPMYKQMQIPAAKILLKNSWGAEIHYALKPLSGEDVIVKARISPFTNPKFKKALKGIKTLILTGVVTNYVVEATAREASDRDFSVIILEDCCASMSQEAHDFSVKMILPGLATVIKSDEL